MARDLAAELAYEEGGWPESWKPEPGDLLVGRLVRKGVRKTRYGPTEVVVTDQLLDQVTRSTALDDVVVEELGPVVMKGLPDPIRLFRVART